MASAGALLDRPADGSLVKAPLDTGVEYTVLGRYEGFLFVQAGQRSGWVVDGIGAAPPPVAVVAGPDEDSQDGVE